MYYKIYLLIIKLIDEKSMISQNNPQNILIDLIEEQKIKENKNSIWNNSPYEYITKLKVNNIGIIGESFIKKICNECNISSIITGSSIKKYYGDGYINNKSIEIKTSRLGIYNSFQHELGEFPWKTDYIIFIDITPIHIYLTIFKNFNKNHYLNKYKCYPIFPTKKITQRKNCGAYKLDTTIKINEKNINNGFTIKIFQTTNILLIGSFIKSSIK
jgi:hypothetical protein